MNKLFLYICIFSTASLMAQQDSTKLKINQVEVVKSFEAQLEEARKVTVKPANPVPKEYKPEYKYDITIVPIDLKYPDPQVKPLAMNPDGPFDVNNGFLHLGYGIKKNPEILAGYHLRKKDAYDGGIQLKYEALDNASQNPLQKYSNAGIDLYGNYLVKENLKVYGELKTDFRTRYFYHTDLGIDTLYVEEQSKRKINSVSLNLGIANPEPTKYQINYDLNLGFRNTKITNQDARENGIGISGKAEKYFRKNTVLSLVAKYDYTAFNGSKAVSLSTSKLLPVLKTKIKNITIEGGANIIYSSDKQSSFFPELMVTLGIDNDKLQVFAGLHQDYYTNHIGNVSLRNAYINTHLDSLQNTVYQEYMAGIKGNYTFLNFQVKAGYKNINQQMFLLNNRDDNRIFDILYDDLGAVFISGNVDFTFSENWSLGGWLTQNIFTLNKIDYAWHTPNLEANAFAKFMLFDQKLQLRSDLFFGNGVPYLDKSGLKQESNVLLDLNIGADYRINDHFSVFIKGINLLDNKFERWYGYPSVGINAMLGVKVIF